ncbi:MAG: SPFH domain-containing protein, partial [Saccharofermentanaceae bacterium]|nr:SPFH domain-containing protein [Saccharofermentanaceae bacterium]
MPRDIIILIAAIVGGIILITVILFAMIKTAKGNEALVVSGVGATDKYGNPKIKRAGGRVVIPFIQKAKYFDLCVRTAKVEGDVTKTQTGVPIQIDWAVAYNPDVSSNESLQRAVCNFLDKNDKELERVILDVVSGGVRAVIAKMTPEEVMNGKDKLDDQVKESISAQMKDLGFNTILSIHEVEDAAGSTYYKDLAARDRETRRRDAANISAEAEQSMREKRAETDRIAQEKELDAQVAVAERQRDTDVKRAQFMAETAREQVKSQMAADLEQETINQQLAEKQGTVLVTKAEQANRAALKQQEVEITRAETQKKTTVINAQAEAERKKAEAAGEAEAKKVSAAGNAEAQKLTAAGEAEAAAVRKTKEAAAQAEARKLEADGAAEARKTEADGAATARKTEAAAEAEAVKVQAEAEATATIAKGKAEAEAIEAKGKAEAEAIEAKGKAEAEAARALSDAQAANDKVNFELKRIEIEQNTRVQVATNIATVMAEVGKNAKFYDFGGGAKQEGGGDLL